MTRLSDLLRPLSDGGISRSAEVVEQSARAGAWGLTTAWMVGRGGPVDSLVGQCHWVKSQCELLQGVSGGHGRGESHGRTLAGWKRGVLWLWIHCRGLRRTSSQDQVAVVKAFSSELERTFGIEQGCHLVGRRTPQPLHFPIPSPTFNMTVNIKSLVLGLLVLYSLCALCGV